MPTKQDTFDKVVEHLRKQGKKAEGTKGCCYRTLGGLRCAAGCLIQDEDYSAAMETHSVFDCDNKLSYAGEVIANQGHDLQLVYELQLVHDNHYAANWEGQFQRISSLYKLTYTAPTASVS